VLLLPWERERLRALVADVLVRTMRSVPVPGVPPFTRRDRLLLVGIIVCEALVVGFLVAAARH